MARTTMGGLDKDSGDLLYEQLAALLRADMALGTMRMEVRIGAHAPGQIPGRLGQRRWACWASDTAKPRSA